MANFKQATQLEIVEAYATYNGLIDSEEAFSERFDEMLKESGFFDTYAVDDEPAINEAFNNYKDSLAEDGELHELQVNQYEYVGDWV